MMYYGKWRPLKLSKIHILEKVRYIPELESKPSLEKLSRRSFNIFNVDHTVWGDFTRVLLSLSPCLLRYFWSAAADMAIGCWCCRRTLHWCSFKLLNFICVLRVETGMRDCSSDFTVKFALFHLFVLRFSIFSTYCNCCSVCLLHHFFRHSFLIFLSVFPAIINILTLVVFFRHYFAFACLAYSPLGNVCTSCVLFAPLIVRTASCVEENLRKNALHLFYALLHVACFLSSRFVRTSFLPLPYSSCTLFRRPSHALASIAEK